LGELTPDISLPRHTRLIKIGVHGASRAVDPSLRGVYVVLVIIIVVLLATVMAEYHLR
jgi:hypothetical protein